MKTYTIDGKTLTLVPKPWWLGWTAEDTFVTLWKRVYCPPEAYKTPENWPHVLAHESIHVGQQEELGTPRFLGRWIVNRKQRLAMEAAGYAAQVRRLRRTRGVQKAGEEHLWAAGRLTTASYLWAARTEKEALAAIQAAIDAQDLAEAGRPSC